ncbi:hypothetical protein N0V90_000364 [Kalmusia sp. IMI 367209]|nr:hypothetical protein N0V90_000364 [Kalmusia sp. IMI 367209]
MPATSTDVIADAKPSLEDAINHSRPQLSERELSTQDLQPSNSNAEGRSIEWSARDPGTAEQTLRFSIIELHALTKHEGWKTLLAELQSLDIAATFDGKRAAIKLRSNSSHKLERGTIKLQKLAKGVRAKTKEMEHLDAITQKGVMQQQVSFHPQPEIIALDAKEDANVLALYHNHLLPIFPEIVQDSGIDGTYSVSLVRQKVLGGSCLVIRFRSSENPYESSRGILRERVEALCVEHSHPVLHIQFTQGTLVHLVGGGSEATLRDDPSNDHKFPHQRRFWGTPGMGASIGTSKCKHVSATSGGMISADNRLYMLTVDHFMLACQLCERTTEIQSPSISDRVDVKQQLAKKFEELSRRIQRNARNEVPLDQVARELFPDEVDEEIEQYKRIEQELPANDSENRIGHVRYRCGTPGTSQPHLRPSINAHSRGLDHRMDWSLTEITADHRKGGRNVHRFRHVVEPTLEDLQMEVMHPEGVGLPCTTAIDVRGGENVLYVGTTSGLRRGTVNTALVQYKGDGDKISHEWSISVPGCELLRSTDFQGDSGAWIISEDNKLLGQLWGWDNGNLLFTPIQDVFADIAQKMRIGTHLVRLPEYSSPQSEHQDSLLCRISTDSLPEVFMNENDEQYDPERLLPESNSTSGRTSRASSWCSIGSLPSLMSGSSSVSETIDAQANTPQELSPPLRTPIHGKDIQDLPVRSKSCLLPSVAIEEWVNVLPDSNAIDKQLSTLQIATGSPTNESTRSITHE